MKSRKRRRVLLACVAVFALLGTCVYIRIRPTLLLGRLMHAIMVNNIAEADAALKSGTNVNGIISEDVALNIAEAVAGHRLDDVGRTTPLLLAAVEGHDNMVRLLVKYGANVNSHGNGDYTPLMFAAENCSAQTVQLLIDKGADINAVTGDDNTPLLVWADKRPVIHALLVRAGARYRDGIAH